MAAQVLVIGAGPVGLAAASELLRHGVSVRLVERKAKANEHSNAAVIHVRTQEILCAMGAVEGVLREGYALPGMRPRALGKRLGLIDVSGAPSPFPAPRMLGQQHTERLLIEHFERLGGKVERAVEAVALEQGADEVRVRLRHLAEGDREESAEFDYVVGCEGSKSVTRESAGIEFKGERYVGKEFLQIDAKIRWNHPQGFGYLFMGKEHVLICLPYDGESFYRIICARADQNPENHEPPTLEEMQVFVREATDAKAELYDPTWFNRFRSGHKLAGHFRAGRTFIAGDAAHVHVPIGGQGMNYGMHDAFNLAWKLAAVLKGEVRSDLLESYEGERRPVDEALIRGTDRGFHILVENTGLVGNAMNLFGRMALGLPGLQGHLRNILGELNVSYPPGRWIADDGGSDGPTGGARAPDALVVPWPERKTKHLFDLFQGTHWTLLLFAGLHPRDDEEQARRIKSLAACGGAGVRPYLICTGEAPGALMEQSGVPIVMDTEELAHEAYGVTEPCLYLIRPDWYVGYRSGWEDEGKLKTYLERVFL